VSAPTRLRVLHVIKCLDRGGAENLIAATLESSSSPEVVYEVAFARSDMAALVRELSSQGHVVHDLGSRSDLDLRWALRLRRLLLKHRYDVVHTHLPLSAGVTRLVVRSLGAARRPSLVHTEHSLHGENGWTSRTLRHLTGRLDDVSLAVSESNRAALPGRLRSRTRVVVHGIDLGRAQLARPREEVRRDLGIAPTAPVALCVANLTAQKGHTHLLTACRLLRSEGLDVTLLVAGDGPLRTELLSRRDAEGLREHVHYLGPRADVLDLMSAADLLVLASTWECMPVVVMEAFAMGLPVVVTATGDLPRVVTPGRNGLLVPPGRPEALAHAMASVLSDETLRSALARGAADSAARFDARRTTRELEELYGELVAR